tara:strand:- start:11566 stop:12117 length:552 start_codon:yes stop_codon:yes gene_type:complete
MGKIIYYSNFCNNCKELLNIITKTDLVKDIHFICIDKRNQKNGKTYVILETNQEVVLPNNITSVPALLLLHDNFKTYFGEDILEYLKPIQKDQINTATNFEGEPNAFSLSNNLGGVASDNYSFLDQSSDDLMAKGSGGLRQMHSYATLYHNDKIETPPDEYTPDKIGDIDLDKINMSRNNEIK